MHTIALLPLVPLSFIAIAFTEHCKKVLGTKHALLQCTSGTESAEKAKEKKKKKKLELNCIRERIPSCFAIFFHINFHFEPWTFEML